MAYDLLGKNFVPPDVHGKVTGKAKYAEDFRAEGMVFCKLLLSPMPHARVRKRRRQRGAGAARGFGRSDGGGRAAAAGAGRADFDQRADVDRPARSRRRGRDRGDRGGRDRPDQGRLRGITLYGRSAAKPVPRRPRRAFRRQRRRQPVDRPAAAEEGEMDGRRLRALRGRPAADGRAARRVVVRRHRRGVREGGTRARRDVRDGRHVASLDGAALGDGLLGERQVLRLRLDAEPELRRARLGELARHHAERARLRRRDLRRRLRLEGHRVSRDGDPGAHVEEDRPPRDAAHHAAPRSTFSVTRARVSRAASAWASTSAAASRPPISTSCKRTARRRVSPTGLRRARPSRSSISPKRCASAACAS